MWAQREQEAPRGLSPRSDIGIVADHVSRVAKAALCHVPTDPLTASRKASCRGINMHGTDAALCLRPKRGFKRVAKHEHEKSRILSMLSMCHTEKATPARHRPERQYNARAKRRKQCSPNETKSYSNPTPPRKRQTNPTSGETPRRTKPSHVHKNAPSRAQSPGGWQPSTCTHRTSQPVEVVDAITIRTPLLLSPHFFHVLSVRKDPAEQACLNMHAFRHPFDRFRPNKVAGVYH